MIKTIYYYLKYRKINKYSSKDMKNYQFDEIKKKIDYAYNNFECYRKLYSENGVHPSDFKKIKDIEKFPIINKDLLESEIKKILKTENSYNWLSTTGSTGSPFNFPVDKNSMAMRRATHLISYKLFDKKVYDKTGIFWRDVRSSRLLKIKEFILRRYWFSIYNIKTKKNIISDKDFIEYNEVILKKNIKQIEGYVSAIIRYCKILEEYNLIRPKLKFVVVGGETLTIKSRKYIEKILNTRVFNRYGGSEISLMAHEENKNKNKLKIMNHRLYLESEGGEFIVTDFTNTAIPFVRYKLGDKGRIKGNYIESIYGRINDEFKIDSKEYLSSHFFHKLLREYDEIINFAVVQEKRKEFTLYLFCKNNYSKLKMEINTKLRKQLKNIKFIIKRSNSKNLNLGKHRHFIPLKD